MVFYTFDEIRNEGLRLSRFATYGADGVLRKSASAGPYDIFLSHSFHDKEIILGLKSTLESAGKKVYVDWIDDPLLDRTKVTPDTARRLRQKMQESRSLIFATSESSPNSKWMPWELGYFDGLRDSESIAIMPLVTFAGEPFVGQEYIGLYEKVEKMSTTYGTRPTIAKRRGSTLETKTLESLVAGRHAYTRR